jgi:AcrR family transcriptional regulator
VSRSTAGRRRALQPHDAIVESTLALLQEVGYLRLTIESVVAHAGVGKATIYRWWSTKANEAIEAIGQRLRQPPPLTGDTDIRAMVLTLRTGTVNFPKLAADWDDERGRVRGWEGLVWWVAKRRRTRGSASRRRSSRMRCGCSTASRSASVRSRS